MYRDLNDYEILYLVKENDEINYEIIYEKYTPLIYKLACKYKKICLKFGYELDDIMQVGYIALFKAVEYYRHEDESLFYTFLLRVIENAIISEIRKNNTLKCRVLNECFSYDILVPDTNNSYIDIIKDDESEITILEDLENEYQYIFFKNTLPFNVACVFEMTFNGFNDKEISILLNMNICDVNNSLDVIKRQLLYI